MKRIFILEGEKTRDWWKVMNSVFELVDCPLMNPNSRKR